MSEIDIDLAFRASEHLRTVEGLDRETRRQLDWSYARFAQQEIALDRESLVKQIEAEKVVGWSMMMKGGDHWNGAIDRVLAIIKNDTIPQLPQRETSAWRGHTE